MLDAESLTKETSQSGQTFAPKGVPAHKLAVFENAERMAGEKHHGLALDQPEVEIVVDSDSADAHAATLSRRDRWTVRRAAAGRT